MLFDIFFPSLFNFFLSFLKGNFQSMHFVLKYYFYVEDSKLYISGPEFLPDLKNHKLTYALGPICIWN